MKSKVIVCTIQLAGLVAVAMAAPAQEHDRRARIDVESYVIDAEVNPRTQSISASAAIKLTPQDDRVFGLAFELNNALNVTRVTDETGRAIPSSRNAQDYTVRLNMSEPLERGKPVTIKIAYEGRLSGAEESPIYGIRFASIQNDFAYLLYPSRWFPVNDYLADRFSAEMNITVPAGYRVLGSGIDSKSEAGEKVTYTYKFSQQSFPGSIGIVKGEPTRVSMQGATSFVYFRKAASMAQSYGDEMGKVMTFATATFGIPPSASLQVMETEDGAPNGFPRLECCFSIRGPSDHNPISGC